MRRGINVVQRGDRDDSAQDEDEYGDGREELVLHTLKTSCCRLVNEA